MRALSSADCLDLWERGLGLHPLDQGLLALGAALPETPYESLAEWPLGRRNSALTELHCACFGRNLRGQVSCPRCAESLEFQVDGEALLKKEPPPHSQPFSPQPPRLPLGVALPSSRRGELRDGEQSPTVSEAEGQEGEGRSAGTPIVVKGHSFRLPTSRDLARAAREGDSRLAAIQLLESCRLEAGDKADWPDAELEEIGEALVSADPLAELRLRFDCVHCGHEWDESLDMVAFLWAEIEARAKRLLMEVHALAAVYGWTEKEILSLSARRRRLYLEMVTA